MRRRFINESKIAFDYNDYMTIEALEDNVEIYLPRVSEYGINGIGWTKYRNKIVVNSGDFISIKDTINKGEAYGNISINGRCNIRGNCLSLIFGDEASSHNDLSGYNNCLRSLLKDNSGVQKVDSIFLSATTLADWCYSMMFQGCTSLTTAPELPATTLKDYCYYSMFQGCTSLTTAPELPATTLAGDCYTGMFSSCDNLITAPELPATTLSKNCYYSMFSYCSKLTTAPELPATTLASSCYRSMFQGCSSLTTAPELPATTLKDYCYYSMFRSCTSLTTAPELPATTIAKHCYESMFQGCSSLTTAPELPATTLKDYCYNSIFYNCSKLNHIKMLATDISANNCLHYWVNGVASTGTFVKNPAMTTLPTATSSNNYAGIPSGWTVVNDGEESGGSSLNLVIDCNNLTQNNVDQIMNYMISKGWTTDNNVEIELVNDSITVIRKNVEYPISWIGVSISEYNGYYINLYVDELWGYPYFWITSSNLDIGFED